MKSLFTKLPVVFFVAATLVLGSSCKKNFLDRKPQGSYTTDSYPYPGGSGPYDTYLFAAYTSLRDYNVNSFPFVMVASVRSDDADKGSTASDGGSDALGMDNFPVAVNNGLNNAFWVGYYNLISKCNIAIDQVLNNKDIVATDQVKLQSEAEARFIRAYAYFMLVRAYGGVPLVDKVFTDAAAQSNIARSTAAQIYAMIEADLNFAATNLPPSWEAKFIGRVTKGAANGMLAKVYLTEKKYAEAMAAANAVMTSGQYDLSTAYDKIFREDGENSKEAVFEVQAFASATNPTDQGVQHVQVQGVRGSGSWDLGWGFNTPSTTLESSYETNDPRKARTILYTSTATVPGVTIYGETTPTGLPNPRYNHKAYTNPAMRSSVGNRFGYWMDVRILRYADVVLMYAEAANEVGGTTNTTNALAALNSVRARARGTSTTILLNLTMTDQALLREAIRQERHVELGMEHDRFWDIVRWGISQTVMNNSGKTAFLASRDNLLPVPQTQIDLSKGVLTQNPGY